MTFRHLIHNKFIFIYSIARYSKIWCQSARWYPLFFECPSYLSEMIHSQSSGCWVVHGSWRKHQTSIMGLRNTQHSHWAKMIFMTRPGLHGRDQKNYKKLGSAETSGADALTWCRSDQLTMTNMMTHVRLWLVMKPFIWGYLRYGVAKRNKKGSFESFKNEEL